MGDIGFWRDVAILVLAVEAILAGLVPLVLFLLGIRGLRWLDARTRTVLRQARARWRPVHRRVQAVDAFLREPWRLRPRPTFGHEEQP